MGVSRAMDAASRLCRRVFAHARSSVLACALLACAPTTPALAGDLLVEQLPASQTLQTPLDKTVALHAKGPVGRVVVSQPELVEVGLAGPSELYVIGRALGSANLLVYDRQGRLSQTLDIQVGYDAQGLRETLADALPDEKVVVTALATGLVLEGEVSSPAAAEAAEALAERAAPDSVISRLHVRAGVVRVDVRIVEANSRSLAEIGAALSLNDGHLGFAVVDLPIGVSPPHTTGRLNTHVGDFKLDAALRGLEDKGELKVVAQPTIVTVSGERATFRAGGELPFPAPQDNAVSVEFRPYGAGLTVQPTIQANGLIQIAIDAELSEIDSLNRISIGGITVPGLITRRATTTAELRDGQSFVIAGLFEQVSRSQARQTPWLSKAPLLGPLLRTIQTKDTRRELAIIVTPHIGAEAPPTLEAVKEAGEGPRPAEPAAAATPRTPKSVAAPRGPPVHAMVRELREALRPPVQWVKAVARRFVQAVSRGPARA